MMHAFNEVIGLNKRNRDLVLMHNPPSAVALANDKVACKKVLTAHGIATPAEIAELRSVGQISEILPTLRACEDGFVLKPSRGSRGRAVVIFARALQDSFVRAQEGPVSMRDFRFMVATIISGEYTAGRPVDSALIEERLRPSNSWVAPGLPGPPDLRVIVYCGRAAMCMARLPTSWSEGKSNLHRGAVGVGVDLETGTTTHAVWKDKTVTHHPNSGLELRGLVVQQLQDCLRLAERCAEAVPLGFMGVDLMLDEVKGPCVIEVNARPGLGIQVANLTGLGSVLTGAARENVVR